MIIIYKQVSTHHTQYIFVTENQQLHSIARNEVIAKAVLVEINISIALYIMVDVDLACKNYFNMIHPTALII